MSKGLRSNRKKALRTIRRADVKGSEKYKKDEDRRLASLQDTAEAGKRARELRTERSQPMETAVARTEPVGEAMEVGEATVERARVHGIPITQKKRLKIQRKKKADGINTLHQKKKKKKGKRK